MCRCKNDVLVSARTSLPRREINTWVNGVFRLHFRRRLRTSGVYGPLPVRSFIRDILEPHFFVKFLQNARKENLSCPLSQCPAKTSTYTSRYLLSQYFIHEMHLSQARWLTPFTPALRDTQAGGVLVLHQPGVLVP